MASERDNPKKEIILVESDFLFGINKSDKRHSQVIHSLKKHKEGNLEIHVLSSAVIEVRSVLYSRGHNQDTTAEFFTLMAEVLANYEVKEFIPIELSDVIIAERMRAETPDLTFFDSLHAATAKRLNVKILSSEGMYMEIGVQTIDLDTI
jgi:predicted nucleic acid-binding protein